MRVEKKLLHLVAKSFVSTGAPTNNLSAPTSYQREQQHPVDDARRRRQERSAPADPDPEPDLTLARILVRKPNGRGTLTLTLALTQALTLTLALTQQAEAARAEGVRLQREAALREAEEARPA